MCEIILADGVVVTAVAAHCDLKTTSEKLLNDCLNLGSSFLLLFLLLLLFGVLGRLITIILR